MSSKDYYKILGISKDASQDEIKKAFRQLARKYHPDINKNAGAEDKFKEINEAFQVLSNPEKKAQYDQFGTSAFNQEDLRGFRNQRFDFDDLFRDFGFGDIFDIFNNGRKEYEDYEEGADLRYDLEITLEDAFYGIEKTIKIPIHEVCKKCNGQGVEEKYLKECDKCSGSGKLKIERRQGFTQFVTITSCDKCHGKGKIASKYCNVCKGKGKIEKIQKINLKIPKGVNDEQYLRLEGKGELGKNAPSGDLYVVVHIKEHPIFNREDENLFLDKKIDLATAIFGGKIEIKNVDKKINLKIPTGTQSHTTFRLKGQGMPLLNSKQRGDLFVRIIVSIPKLSKLKEKFFRKLVK